MNLQSLVVGLIDPPRSALRADFDQLQLDQLADSMRTDGQLQPIGVLAHADRYEIVYGHRRYLAAVQLQWTYIDAVILTDQNAQRADLAQIAENFQRADLSPMEEARALSRAIEAHGMSITQLALSAHRRPEWVTARIALLNLPEDLAPLVHTRALAVATATALARCTDPVHRAALTTYALESGASAHVTAQWVSAWRFSIAAAPDERAALPFTDPNGQRPIVQLPCPMCQQPHDYTTMVLTRLCHPCYAIITRPEP